MADVLSRHDRARIDAARRIAARLEKELEPCHGDEGVMRAFVDLFVPPDGDPDAIKAHYASQVSVEMIKAVRAYCDWVASGIVRSGGYAARPLPVPDTVATAKIAARAHVRPLAFAYAVARLRESDALPLLGRIDQGCLIPDAAAIDDWKACFDWSGSSAP